MSLDTGSTTYFGDDDTSFDTGVTNATPPVTVAPPDASGGTGSFLPGLLNTLTNGVNATLAAELNANFGQGIAAGLATVDPNGNLTYKATPARTPTVAQVATAQAISYTPWIIIGAVAIIAVLALRR